MARVKKDGIAAEAKPYGNQRMPFSELPGVGFTQSPAIQMRNGNKIIDGLAIVDETAPKAGSLAQETCNLSTPSEKMRRCVLALAVVGSLG
jgi:hypothetical protein